MFSSLRAYHTDKLAKVVTRFFLLTLVVFLSQTTAFGQDSELGMELGGYTYLGDVNRKFSISDYSLGGQFFVRRNLNDALSYRVSLGAGKLSAVDDEAFDIFSANRSASFEGSFINSDFLLEYHFLNYRNDRLEQFWTPYVFFGLGLYRMQGDDGFSNEYNTGIKFRVPVGVGIKYRFNKRWILAVSTSAIKTNSDEIDNVSAGTPNIKDYSGGNPNDDDWMFYTAISLSFTFHKIVCPEGWFK